ncbi:hypothetical protein [Lederbergia lenta]|uniref:hypothetical protein n=1 Tax=Lederbergia lenta TaxID=1467 RepID=UPI00203F635E|nr:hypothetical protein [Lederbergia lenta]MCM3109644.1 hypothetical protein [Lederbergia lenta]
MIKLGFNLLFICLYCFPFVYFSMYQDFSNGSMIGYLLMVISTSIIAFFAKYTKNTIAIILGNIISMDISFYFITKMQGNEPWAGYFKPLTPLHLLITTNTTPLTHIGQLFKYHTSIYCYATC